MKLYLSSVGQEGILDTIFKKEKPKEEPKTYDMTADEFRKVHPKNVQIAKQLLTKCSALLKTKYKDLLKKGALSLPTAEDYKDMTDNVNDKSYGISTDSDGRFSYALINWDIWQYTAKAREVSEQNKFYAILKSIETQVSTMAKPYKDFTVENQSDWDDGSIDLVYNKTISKVK